MQKKEQTTVTFQLNNYSINIALAGKNVSSFTCKHGEVILSSDMEKLQTDLLDQILEEIKTRLTSCFPDVSARIGHPAVWMLSSNYPQRPFSSLKNKF